MSMRFRVALLACVAVFVLALAEPAFATMQGYVYDEITNAPLAGVLVEACFPDGQPAPSPWPMTTDAQGYYCVPTPYPAAWIVRFSKSGYFPEYYNDCYAGPYYAVGVAAEDGQPIPTANAALLPTSAAGVVRTSGNDRYETCLAISRSTYQRAEVMLIASGENYPDSLAAAPLAAVHQAPLLLVRPKSIPSGLVAEARRLGVKRYVVVGGTSAVGAEVEAALNKAGFEFMHRIGGRDRYETMKQVAKSVHINYPNLSSGDMPFIVRGDAFPDALAISAYAYQEVRPIILVGSKGASAASVQTMELLGAERAIVVGGEQAVSDDSLSDLAAGAPHQEFEYYRIEGNNRYDTAFDAARVWLQGDPDYGEPEWLSVSHLAIASGANFPDALSGGIAAGSRGGVLLLTPPDTLYGGAHSLIQMNSPSLPRVHVLGGRSALSDRVANAAKSANYAPGTGVWSLGTPSKQEWDVARIR